ncbi:uncharacterized protein NEMAJ01_0705 [Nematocida major]|uniref:uncharacterized protein n=1 Tax=Nematocida major TaxID=1912982 RepID=UPI00200871D5|nr:uncharacterized protein NEMAJ01_0705 [Nematocida major]KAH9385809.1 hypothetical protein NEMAJ01_0705 [Nematocida major]
MQREDGRTNLQHREIHIDTSKHVLFSCGLTKVHTELARAPRPGKKPLTVQILPSETAAPNNPSPRITRDRENHELSLENIFTPILLDTHTYTISARVICDNGSLLSALINSISLALVRFKVPIKHMIFSTTAATSPESHNSHILDLLQSEESSHSSLTLAIPYTKHGLGVSYAEISGPLSGRAFSDLLDFSVGRLQEVSERIFAQAETVLK